MKTLVIAEKPSVGRDIARVLKCSQNGNGYIEGPKYIVTWALGHLVTLADPEKYDSKYKSWKIEDLPMLPSPMKLEVIGQTGKQYNSVKSLLQRQDVSDIVIATDAGREGELVARWILLKAGVKKPVKRLWISSVTDRAILDGFSHLQAGEKYLPLYEAAYARAQADWYVGLNATRALTCKHNAQLSCGRVQTPTLAIIASREKEIKNFKPQAFYGVTASVNGFDMVYRDAKNNQRIFEKSLCEGLLKSLSQKPMTITEVKKTPKKSFSPALYDLTELQRDANKYFGYSAKETLSIMQNLYEHHKVLTYPRTDSRYISSDIVPTIKSRLEACSVSPYSKFTKGLAQQPIRVGKHFVDDSKVSDHHAIIPTEETVFLRDLSDKEFKIYDLVIKRFIAVLLPAYEYMEMSVTGKIDQAFFYAKGRTVTQDGWKAVYDIEDTDDPDSKDDQKLPDIKTGETLQVKNLKLTEGKTSPPAPFTEATLLTAMENPAKYMESTNPELVKTLGETGGLGTVATRADIIEKLLDSFLIEKVNNQLHVTSKGLQLLELVPEEMKSPILTAKWEMELAKIAKGTAKREPFIDQMKAYTEKIVQNIKNSSDQFKHTNVTGNRCPNCGKFMLEVNGKKGKMLICQDRECGYKKAEARITNARCPECHKKLELHGQGDGQIFVCKCGYREKMSAFQDRRKNDPTKVSKNEVNKYLQKQNQEDTTINSAFADILKKMK